MNLSFYTIDDLRLGPNLWTETRFDAVQDILTHHRNLPGDTVKELGLMNGARKLPLIRRVGLSPGGLDHDRLVPKPAELPEELRQGGFGPPVVRRAYIAATGWLSPSELKRRFPEESGAFSYPLVLKYLADVHLDDGPRTMELTHWDLRRLESRAGTFAASK